MDRRRFMFLMSAVDDDLLEEAQYPVKKSRAWLRIVGAAACLALFAVFWFLARSGEGPGTAASGPVYESTVTEVAQLGYVLPIPEDAQNASYLLIDRETPDSTPMAEVIYERGGGVYSCRALRVEQAEDISGLSDEWEQSLDWKNGTLQMQLRQSDTSAWVGWYGPDAGVQWCLSGGGDALGLLHTAQSIVEALGYSLTVSPEGAEDVLYNAFELNGLVVGETVFSLNGVSYSYRMAQTWEIQEEFADISGIDEVFRNETEGSVLWCPARLSYEDGGAGKVVWFDVVPGLLYSLSIDQGASEEVLLEMANQLFEPAQGDVG